MSSCAKSPNVAAQPLGRPDLSLALYLAALAAAVGLYLPLGALGAATDWWRMDESYTWSMVQLGLGGIIRRTAGDVHPPLYYLLLAPWVRVWHEPAVMQLFSLAAGLGALLAIAWTGCLLRGRRLGVLAALLWATFPMFLHYCQDGRMYSLALLFETLAFAGWALAGRRPRAGWVLTVAALTASVYTHNLCLIFSAALLGCELARVLLARRRAAPGARRRGGLAWVVAAGLAVALLYAPWAVVLRHQLQNVSVRHGFHPPLWGDVAQAFLFHDYTLGFTTPDHGWAWLPGGLLMALLPLAGVLRPAGRPAGGGGAAGRDGHGGGAGGARVDPALLADHQADLRGPAQRGALSSVPPVCLRGLVRGPRRKASPAPAGAGRRHRRGRVLAGGPRSPA